MENEIFMKLLEAGEFKAVRSVLGVMNEVDIASLLSELEGKELAQAFRLIPKGKAAEVFANMTTHVQTQLIGVFTENELKALLGDMFLDDTVDLLEDLPANVVTRILESVDPTRRQQINELLQYPDDSAGSIMTTEYVDLRPWMTVAQTLDHIREVAIHKETIYTCYVLEARRLLGIVTAKDLLTAASDTKIEDLMEKEFISVHTHDDEEQVAALFSKYGLLAMPVLDSDERMVGIVTVDDAMDVMVAETTEDISIMAGINPSEESYFDTPVLRHARNRIPWLLVLMLSATITGTIITRYEDAFAAVPILVAFIPMLMDTGGNCGSQSSTLVIRSIALDEIRFSDIFRVMFKELRISLVVGAVLSVVNGLRVLLMYHDPKLALVIGFSLLATVVLSKLIGCMLPLMAKRGHLDPAIMASPLITTLVDTCSILIYFNMAARVFDLAA